MDPDVAHPRHQSNQTVRNREKGVAGVRGESFPWLQGCFFLKVVRRFAAPFLHLHFPHPPTSTHETHRMMGTFPDLIVTRAADSSLRFISSDDMNKCVMGTFQRGERTSC